MNERYLFKAKRTANGEWVKGFLFNDGMINPEHYFIGSIVIEPYKGTADDDWNITGHCFYEVDASTICACTGLRDVNGKLIWENDIVFVTDEEGNSGQVDTGVGEVDFLEGLWYISGNVQNALYDIDKEFQIEVIGSIFDNPELLEVGE